MKRVFLASKGWLICCFSCLVSEKIHVVHYPEATVILTFKKLCLRIDLEAGTVFSLFGPLTLGRL